MNELIPVHCVKCSKVLFKVKNGSEFEIICKCPYCKYAQKVRRVKDFRFDLETVKLSTGRSLQGEKK